MSRVLLKNANIIDNQANVTENQNIYIVDNKIEKIIATQTDMNDINDNQYEVIDCTDRYVTPGFVNLHAHCAMNLFRGISEDVCIDRWFNEKIFPYESKLAENDVYYGTLLGIAEMLNNGVTSYADHYFNHEEVLRAVLNSNIRADIAPTIFGLAPDYKDKIAEVKEFIVKNRDISPRVALRFGPHAPYTCPGEILTEIIDAAKELNTGIHIHISETEQQVTDSIKSTGKTPFQNLYESGGFDVNCILAHGLWVTEDDLKLVNDNATFAFCPKTYMKLSMGKGNIYKFKNKINYTFGTDGGASSNTLSPVEQARLFALNGKLLENDAEDFIIKDVWAALMNGHNALSFNTGKIEAGYDADLLIWNLNKVNTYPIYNPVTSILYSSDASNIEFVMVNGEFAKYNGVLKMDVEGLLKTVGDIQNEVLKRGQGKSKISY